MNPRAPHIRCAALCGALLAVPLMARSEVLPVPSGQPVTFHDVIRDARGAAGLTYRFRFVAPGIAREGGSIPFEAAAADMEHLCNAFVVDRLSAMGPKPARVIVSLSDRPTEFGAAAPEVTQYFEAYRIEEGVCIWEGLW